VTAPELRDFSVKIANYLQKAGYDGLFLPFSKELKEYLAQFGEGIPYDYVMNELKKSKLLPEPIKAWEYSAEPILRALPQIKRINSDLQAYCYGDPFYEKTLVEILVESTILTLKSSITGEIETEKWRKLLLQEHWHRKEALQKEIEFIVVKAGQHGISVCVSGSNGIYIASELEEEGYKTRVTRIGETFSPTPLDVLRKEINTPEISDERIKELVLLHIKYIKEYVLRSQNPDQAYRKWHLSSNKLNKKIE